MPTSRFTMILTSLFASIFPFSLAAPQPPSFNHHLLPRALPSDTCGPQGNTNTFSTCDEVASPTGNRIYDSLNLATVPPSLYGYTCLKDHSGESLQWSHCYINANTMCSTISRDSAGHDRWLWSSGDSNCTFGVWLPTTAQKPAWERCMRHILEPTAEACGLGEGANVGAINLKSLPSTAEGTTGEAVDPDYPSYIMEAQTYDDGRGPF